MCEKVVNLRSRFLKRTEMLPQPRTPPPLAVSRGLHVAVVPSQSDPFAVRTSMRRLSSLAWKDGKTEINRRAAVRMCIVYAAGG